MVAGLRQQQLTLSEGDLVRSTNDLYKSYGVGYIQKIRGEQAKVEFNPSVFMQPPYRSENKILHLKELERVDSPLDRARRGQWDEPWRFELKMLAARFLTDNKGGQLSNARTEILPHQIFAAHRVVASPRRRFLLADEVGLGKTIEAGMIWQALEQRGQAKRTLIIVPAGLTTQWQEEMQDKFGCGESKDNPTFEIRGHQYCDAMLLLTATPHQGEENHSRFKNLLRLLEEYVDFSALEDKSLF